VKKSIVIAVLLIALVGFTTIGLAATAKGAAALKPAKISGELIQGKIVSIDKTKNEIVVKDDKTGVERTIAAKSKIIASLKVGEEVKVTLKGGSNTAEKVKIITSAKKVK